MIGMTVIVKTITRWVTVFIFLYGAYITITGHLTPGGGFAGGVIIACSYILLTLAFGKEFSLRRLPVKTASRVDGIGAFLFLAIGLFGIWFSGTFFVNFLERLFPGKEFRIVSSGMIPLINIAICLKVSVSLFLAFIIMAVLRIETGKDGTRTMVQTEEEE
jgi:multisubunit Na+/H+ antiporter MnhB subunit